MPSGGTEGEKGKRYDLVFQCCPPPPRPTPLCLIPLRVCLHGYRQALCLPNTTGGPRDAHPFPLFLCSLFLLHSPLLLSLLSLLDHHAVTSSITSSLHHATLILAFQVISKHRWCLDVAAQILKLRMRGPVSKHIRDSSVVRHESSGFHF